MWLAFIIALALEIISESRTVERAIGYILLAIFMSVILSPILAFIAPVEAYQVAWSTYLLANVAYAVIGLIVAKILKIAARG